MRGSLAIGSAYRHADQSKGVIARVTVISILQMVETTDLIAESHGEGAAKRQSRSIARARFFRTNSDVYDRRFEARPPGSDFSVEGFFARSAE